MSDEARTIKKVDRFMVKARAEFAMVYSARCKKKFSNCQYYEKWTSYFNVGGNHFRVITKIFYGTQIVQIRFAGSHAEYDRIDAETI